MMSCMPSTAWSHPVLSLCCTEHGPYCGAILSGRITSVTMSRSGQLGQRHTVAAYTFVDTLVMHERALKTREPSCMPRAAKPLFIPVVHSPPGAVGHVVATELPSQEGKARSHGTCVSTRAHLIKEARFKAEGHVAVSELTSARRRGPEPRDTWWRWSPPLQ
jgi:hypothetical protein